MFLTQAEIQQTLVDTSLPHLPALLDTIRKRITRFNIMMPGAIIWRVRNRISYISAHTPPAVLAVFIRSIYIHIEWLAHA